MVGLFALMLVLGSAPRAPLERGSAESTADSAMAAEPHCVHAAAVDSAAAALPEHGKGCSCCSADACACAPTSLSGSAVALLIAALPAAREPEPVAPASPYATRGTSPLRPPIV